jgi:hypothetical protein
MIVPEIGAFTSVSSIRIRAFSTATWAFTTSALALATPSRGGLQLLGGDRLRLEELVGPLLLGLGVGQPRPRHLELGLALGHRVPRAPLVNAYQQVAPPHGLAGLDLDLEDLARGLRLHFHQGVRLHGPRRAHRNGDGPPFHRNGLIDRGRDFLLAGQGQQDDR